MGHSPAVQHRITHLVWHTVYLQDHGEGPIGAASRSQVTGRHMSSEGVSFHTANGDITSAMSQGLIERKAMSTDGIDGRRTWLGITRAGITAMRTHDEHWGHQHHTWQDEPQPQLPATPGE